MVRKHRSLKKLLAAFGVAMVAALAMSVVSVASASAASQHWYTCKSQKGSGFYSTSTCNGKKLEKPSGDYEWVKLPEVKTPTKVALKGTSPFTLKFNSNGVIIEIACTTLSGEGSIANDSTLEGGPGSASNTSFKFKGCTVPTAAKCSIWTPGNGTGSYSFLVKGEDIEFEGKPAVKFSGSEGSTLTEITFLGSECGINGTSVAVSGTFTGISNSAIVGTNALFEFTAASSALQVGLNPVTFKGTNEIVTTTGNLVKIAP